jgi:hypothetical protein
MADVPGVTASTIGDHLVNQIINAKSHTGTATNKAFFSQVTVSRTGQNELSGYATQDALHFFPTSEGSDLYMSYWIRFQPGLTRNMVGLNTSAGGGVYGNGGTWRTFFALKTGTSAATNDIPANNGDYRIEVYLMTGCSSIIVDRGQAPCQVPCTTACIDVNTPNPAPFWAVIADNVAGGGYPLANGWSETNTAIPVPDDGSWNKVEIYFHRSSGNDGRFWMGVNGTQLFNHVGPNMGQASLPINRIMPFMLYSGGYHPIYQWVDDLQIWTGGFPSSSCTTESWCDPPYASH